MKEKMIEDKINGIRKDDIAVSPVIAVILMVAITVVLAGVLYVWVSRIPTGETQGVPISTDINEKAEYWELEIIEVSGTLKISDLKINIISTTGTQLFSKSATDTNPTPIKSGESTIYPVPSNPSIAVYENSSNGDGQTIDTESVEKPHLWEGCFYSFLDAQSNGRVNAGDIIRIYKDYNDNGADDIKPGYKIKFYDGDNNNVLSKEL